MNALGWSDVPHLCSLWTFNSDMTWKLAFPKSFCCRYSVLLLWKTTSQRFLLVFPMNGPYWSSSRIHFIPFSWCEALICLARGAFGFTGGVTNWCIAPVPGHVFSVHTHFLNTDTDTVVQTSIQKLIHCSVSKHVFSVRSADTHSLNQPPHSLPLSSCIDYKDAFLRPEYKSIPCLFAFGPACYWLYHCYRKISLTFWKTHSYLIK